MIRPRLPRRTTAAMLWLLAGLVSCDDPTKPLPCTGEATHRCWTYLGPPGVLITCVAEAAGTYFASTLDGLLKYDADLSQLVPAGLAGLTWRSLPVPRSASGGMAGAVTADGAVLVGTRGGASRVRLG